MLDHLAMQFLFADTNQRTPPRPIPPTHPVRQKKEAAMTQMRLQNSMPCILHGKPHPGPMQCNGSLEDHSRTHHISHRPHHQHLRLPRAHAIDADAAGKARGPRAETALRLPQSRHLLIRHLAQRRRRPPALLDGRRRLAVRCQVEADEEQQVR